MGCGVYVNLHTEECWHLYQYYDLPLKLMPWVSIYLLM